MTTPTQPSPGGNSPYSFTGPISDLQFQREIPDDASAAAWFIAAWGQRGPLPDCPRGCRRGRVATPTASASKKYRCKQCKKWFSIKTDSLMFRSHLGLKKWAHLVHVWSGGDGPSSADELERRSGLSDGTGDDASARLLTAATEVVTPLDEDCVFWWFIVGRQKETRVYAFILKGCVTGRTVIEKLPTPPGRDARSFGAFLSRNMRPNHSLFLENPNLVGVRVAATPRGLGEIGDPKLSQSGLQKLQRRVDAVIKDVYHGVSMANLDLYLAGIQWWENNRDLSHRERARLLAQGLRYPQRVPLLNGARKRRRKPPAPLQLTNPGPAQNQ